MESPVVAAVVTAAGSLVGTVITGWIAWRNARRAEELTLERDALSLRIDEIERATVRSARMQHPSSTHTVRIYEALTRFDDEGSASTSESGRG